MDDIQFSTKGSIYTCPECKNDNQLPDDVVLNDVLECEFCGIEFRVVDEDENSNYILEIIEEEK